MTLRAVWARRPEAAKELAEAHGAQAVDDFDELLDQVDAVAFAVPPAVQAELAVKAAEAGKHLILEKPIAADLDGALRLADAVEAAGVAALVVLILRFSPMTREWLDGIKEAGGWRSPTSARTPSICWTRLSVRSPAYSPRTGPMTICGSCC